MTDVPPQRANIAIIGGGAAGLTAAIFAAEAARERRVVVLDGAPTLGAKILVAGGGRCNVTHDLVTPDDFNGSRNIVRNILAAFDATAAVRWFNELGVELKREDTGKLFPITDSARTVLNALLDRCRALGVTIQTKCKVTGVAKMASGFTINSAGGYVECERIILCAGGKSLPRSGSDGSGWTLAQQLGHSVTATYPALVPLVLSPPFFHDELSGIAHDVELTTLAGGKRIDRRTGSLLWTHFGISGPVVMDASRHWVIAKERAESPQLLCNALPGETFESAERWLIDQLAARPKATVVNVIGVRFPERLTVAFLRHAGIDPAVLAGQVSRELRRNLAKVLTELVLPVAGARGWNYAEVTAGGVPLNEIDYRTMESRKTAGVYLAGEILDCDGRIGGFNFQWAWATGYLAGRAAGGIGTADGRR